jgi:O-antigen/teichoic acid export membrane protein
MEKMRAKAYGFLRWTEKYIKTDMVYAASGGFWLFLGQAINALVTLVLAVAFANLLEPEKYGNYKYIISLASIIGALTLTGLGTALLRSSARGHDGALEKSFNLMLRWSIGMVAIGALAGGYYLLNGNQLLGYSLLLVGSLSPILASSSLYRPFLIGKKEFKRATFFGLAQSGVPAVTVLTGLLLSSSVNVLIAIYFISSAATTWFLYTSALKLAKNDTTEPETERLGKHVSVMNIISTIAGKLDSILLFQFMGGAQLAIFAFATAIPDHMRASLKNIGALAIPKLAHKEKIELKRIVYDKSVLIFILTVLMAVVYVAAAPYLFAFFFPQYMSAVIYSQVYAVTILLSLTLSTAYFDAQIAIKERYTLNIISSMTIIVFTVGGILLFGIWGAIFARIASRVVIVTTSALLIARH